jgi:hypothetical protein
MQTLRLRLARNTSSSRYGQASQSPCATGVAEWFALARDSHHQPSVRTPAPGVVGRCRNPSGPYAIFFIRLLPFLSGLSALSAAGDQPGQASCSLRAFRSGDLSSHRAAPYHQDQASLRLSRATNSMNLSCSSSPMPFSTLPSHLASGLCFLTW